MTKSRVYRVALPLVFAALALSWFACQTTVQAAAQPDQICLTWTGDPSNSQTIQWRTAPEISDGAVEYRKKDEPESAARTVAATPFDLKTPSVVNDPVNRRFTAALSGLEPATAYLYRVGSKAASTWSPWTEFKTAPQGRAPFSFIYMGDAQVGLDTWGQLLHRAFESFPGAAFYMMAGDNVNRGDERPEWDSLFKNAEGVYDRRDVVPALGNHDCKGIAGPQLYLELFALPENGPDTIAKERAYSFHYSNALIVVLDGNSNPKAQRPWLEQQLANANATWKFIMFHQPAYSSGGNRDNPEIREAWCDVFDTYHVDMVLQGHDHAYLRTYPMKANHIVDSAAEGTYYVVSVSGTKHYKQEQHDYTQVGFTDVSTYQVIDIDTKDGDKMTYRAYDFDGNVRDEVVIEKK